MPSFREFTIDLENDPEERWKAVIDEMRESLEVVMSEVETELDSYGLGGKLWTGFLKQLGKVGGVLYGKEIEAIARQIGADIGQMIAMQLSYEIHAACTSVVIPYEKTGGSILARTLDWEMYGLDDLTINLNVERSGKLVFRCVTWAGFVGVLTGVRPGGYAVSLNHRATANGNLLKNALQGARSAWPGAFLIRELLADVPKYDEAVESLANSELMAPCYLTVAGPKKGQGAVIVRDRREGRILTGARLAQTNHDPDAPLDLARDDVPWSQERRDTALAWLENRRPLKRMGDAWRLLNKFPIENETTIYACIMDPATGTLQTRVP